jgi:hypothetical protein
MADDASDDGKWLTYQQLAEIRRISKPSAIRLVMRHRWRRQRDNERVVRVLVPPGMLEPDRAPHDAPHDASDDTADDAPDDATGHRKLLAGALAALEDAVAGLREQLANANRRASVAEARAEQDATLIANLEADLRTKDAEAGALRERLEGAEAVLTTERQRAEASITDLEADLRAKDAEIAEQRSAADQTRTEAQQVQEAARLAREQAETLRQAEEARKGRGRFRRAWDGWRGR